MINNPHLPINEGTNTGYEDLADGTLTPKPLKISPKTTFKDLIQDYEFFTHGALVLYGGLPFDCLLQFYAEKRSNERPCAIITDIALFDGLQTLDDDTFNRLLFAVPKEVWPELAMHFGTIGVNNPTEKIYYNVIVQDVPMIDYLHLQRYRLHSIPDQVPSITIHTIALDGNRVCLHFQPAKRPYVDKIKLVRSAPRDITVKFANNLFAGKPVLEKDPKEPNG